MRDLKHFRKLVTSSGLTVFFQKRSIPWFTAGLVVGVGERHDPPGKIGLAHLLEHMLHTKTQGYPKRNIVQLENWLAANNASVDLGSTELDCTYFYGSASPNHLRLLFRYLNALVRFPSFNQRDLEKQISLIRAERVEDGTDRYHQANRSMRRAVFGNHPMAMAGTWPTDKELRGLTLTDVRRMHAEYYGLPNMRLVVIGGLDADRLMSAVEKFFVAYAGEPEPRPEPPPFEFPKLETREAKLPVEDGYSATSVYVDHLWHMPPVDAPVLLVASEALERILKTRIREGAQAAYDVSVSTESYIDHRVLKVETEVSPRRVSRVRKIIEAATADFAAIAREAPRAKKVCRTRHLLTDWNIDELLEEAIDDIVLVGRPIPIREMQAANSKATVDKVISLFENHIRPDNAFVRLVET
jgi:predicted Zn-dependent peptidase